MTDIVKKRTVNKDLRNRLTKNKSEQKHRHYKQKTRRRKQNKSQYRTTNHNRLSRRARGKGRGNENLNVNSIQKTISGISDIITHDIDPMLNNLNDHSHQSEHHSFNSNINSSLSLDNRMNIQGERNAEQNMYRDNENEQHLMNHLEPPHRIGLDEFRELNFVSLRTIKKKLLKALHSLSRF